MQDYRRGVAANADVTRVAAIVRQAVAARCLIDTGTPDPAGELWTIACPAGWAAAAPVAVVVATAMAAVVYAHTARRTVAVTPRGTRAQVRAAPARAAGKPASPFTPARAASSLCAARDTARTLVSEREGRPGLHDLGDATRGEERGGRERAAGSPPDESPPVHRYGQVLGHAIERIIGFHALSPVALLHDHYLHWNLR